MISCTDYIEVFNNKETQYDHNYQLNKAVQ